MTVRSVDLTPTWTTAVRIYIEVLENGSDEGKATARQELLRLASIVDAMNEEAAEDS